MAAADAEGGNQAVFLDSTGKQTDVVPDGTGDAEAGVVTAVAYVEAGTAYYPLIYTEVSAAEEEEFNAATGTTDVEVEVEEEVTVKATATFNPAVDEGVIDAIEAVYGKSIDREGLYTAAGEGWAATDEEKAYMSGNSLAFVCSLPQLGGLADGSYIAKITFDNTPGLDVVGAPRFYPDGVNATGAATSAKIYTYASGSATEVTASNAKSIVENGRTAYLVFEVANDAVATADFDAAAATLSKPAIVVSNTSSPSPGPTSPDIRGVGSSSGGCSAGSAVLALAVLGSFVLVRRK
ncbi:MAG: hypothetical protein IJP86_10060 [Synergistaceae bacterium]|nr:hypothetical protein [Synergistaceae bacterium]